MKIALVHDFLIRLGGAERVLAAFAEIFPQAPIHTLFFDEARVGSVFPKEKIAPSSLMRLPKAIRSRHRLMLPLFPRALEEWDFSNFDLVVCSSTAFAHGVLTGIRTRHVSYIHSPARFAWDWTHEYMRELHVGFLKRTAATILLKKIRMWDFLAADRTDLFIANSENVRRRIRKYYRKDAKVIYPPVELSRFRVSKSHENYFLIISNLSRYKRIDLAVELFNKIGRRLVIIGDGPEKAFLQDIAGSNIEFLGRQSDEAAAEYLQHCRALLFPGEDDFGITPVEAMACGKPVIAFGKGGALESVIEGETGEFFREPTVAAFEEALARLFKNEYSPARCRKQAEQFSKDAFIDKMKSTMRI